MDVAPGTICPHCSEGTLRAYGSHLSTSGRVRVRYYRCSHCGWTPANNKMVIPAEYAPPRVKMRRPSSKLGERARN